MDLSVIIVSYKGWNKLTACLEALDKFNEIDFSMELIIVDNHSKDPYIEVIKKKFPNFRFIENERNGGYANGCNLGFSHSSGDNILILNPDTIATGKAVGSLLEAVNSTPGFYVVSCTQHRSDGREAKASGRFPGLFNTGLKFKHDPEIKNEAKGNGISYPDWVSGSVMMFRRDIFKMLNGFDEDYWMYYEDVDICARARLAGGQVAMLTSVSIQHDHGGSSRIDPKTTALTKCEVQASRHIYISKHMQGFPRILNQVIAVMDNTFTGLLTFTGALLLFPLPAARGRILLFINLVKYYLQAVYRNTWLSPRSVNYT